MNGNQEGSPGPNPLKETAVFFNSQEEFRTWLEMHHEKETELMVGFYKVASGKPSMSWSESVDQALCFGWIDGIRKSIDRECYCIRFTPRRPGSNWSEVNIRKAEALTEAGLMKAAGLKAFSLRKVNEPGISLQEKDRVFHGSAYEKRFREDPEAWAFFVKQAPSYKKAIMRWIMSGVQEKTRQSRLEKAIRESRQHKRVS
ncbi:MAG: YdeI/OmpD-associated family protein [Bacteroides sp.]|jgi:uncharacterized protein YdeI (YjbR/CyaY-like superfamily)|nr:YdeI/OmpD-associated family protein [Bacteroides sp.]